MASEIDQYARKLGFTNAYCSSSSKMWLFLSKDWNIVDLVDSNQQVTITFSYFQKLFKITSIYARCCALKRLELWDSL